MKLPDQFAAKIARPMLKLKRNSPRLMFVAGTVGVVTAGVLACRSTLKLSDVLADNEEAVDARNLVAEQNEDYRNGEHAKDITKLKIRLILDVAKLYAPAAGVALVSIGLLTGSHVTLSKRNAAGAAAYAALDKAYRGMQERVEEKYGKEEADKLRQGVVTVEETTTDDAGKTKKTKREVAAGKSPYAALFTEGNQNWHPGAHNNWFFLNAQQNYMNDRLQSRGFVFLNDVYEAIGLPKTKAGQIVGWMAGEQGRDGYISFGIDNERSDAVRDFMAGREDSIWLDFNVDGDILNSALL